MNHEPLRGPRAVLRSVTATIASLVLVLAIPGQAAGNDSAGRPELTTQSAALQAAPEQDTATRQDTATKEDVAKLKRKLKDLEKRVMANERKTALDRIDFTGDFRFEAHSIDASVPAHFDGMVLQNLLVNTLFYYGATGQMPPSLDAVNQVVASHYAEYLFFTQNLSFEDLKQMMGQFPPEAQQQLLGMLRPATAVGSYDADNLIMYTSRLRLRMQADVADDISFSGRLAMYKVWGDSTGVQVFNGQPTSINVDGTTAGVPNSDILRVERAYFTWKDIGELPMYLSIGRRPSTGGVPLNFRQDEPRGGTPMGSLINYQFDGITVGYHLSEQSTFRLCYGVGYESGFGNGDVLQLPQDRLDDASFLGINWDVWDSPDMFIQATVARAFDVTDGFNALVVLPNNPVTGQEVGAPVVMRFTPSANLGDIDLASLVLVRHDGPVDWFASVNYMESSPNDITTPFGGLLSDPFEVPTSHSGTMWYVGARYNFPNGKTKLGLELNHGSKYWFNFAAAEDDIIAPKTNTRGDVWEAYLTHRIARSFVAKLDLIKYSYDYSGSGWHVGAPKDLDSMPVLGFPAYDEATKLSLSLSARF